MRLICDLICGKAKEHTLRWIELQTFAQCTSLASSVQSGRSCSFFFVLLPK